MNGFVEEWRNCETCAGAVPVDALEALNGARLLDQVITAPENRLRPRFRPATALAYGLSLLILAANLVVALAGLYLVIHGWPDVVPILCGIVLVLAGWLLRPRLGSVPEDCLKRSHFPNLFSMVDGIAGQLSVRPVEHVRVDHRYRASLTRAGPARTPVLTIGLPLWACLAGQERVALIAHELAHRVNRDPARGAVIGWSVAALDHWVDRLDPSERPARSLAETATGLARRVMSAAARQVRGLLARLLYLDSQRAEYLADHLTAKVAGPVATTKLLGKLGLARNLRAVAGQVHSGGDTGQSVIDAFRAFVEAMPEGEMERLRQADEAEKARTDSSHPPTASRLTFIRSRHFELPLVILSDALSRAIDEELQPLRERLSIKLVERFASTAAG